MKKNNTLYKNYYESVENSVRDTYFANLRELLNNLSLVDLNLVIANTQNKKVSLSLNHIGLKRFLVCYEESKVKGNTLLVSDYSDKNSVGIVIHDTLYTNRSFICKSLRNDKTIHIEDISDFQLNSKTMVISKNHIKEDMFSWNTKRDILLLLSKIGDFFYTFE